MIWLNPRCYLTAVLRTPGIEMWTFLEFLKTKNNSKLPTFPTSKLAMNLSGDTEETTKTSLLQTHSNYTDTFPNISTQFALTEDENNHSSQTFSLIVQASAAFIGFIGNGIFFVVLKRNTSISSGTSFRVIAKSSCCGRHCLLYWFYLRFATIYVENGIYKTLDRLISQV